MKVSNEQLEILAKAAYKQLVAKKTEELKVKNSGSFHEEFKNIIGNLHQMVVEYEKLEEQLKNEEKVIEGIFKEFGVAFSSYRSLKPENLEVGGTDYKYIEVALMKKHNLIPDLNEGETIQDIKERILLSNLGDYQKVIDEILIQM